MEPSPKGKVCSKCGIDQPLEVFPRPHGAICRTCRNTAQRRHRASNQNSHTFKYEKTPNGFLMRTYRNMLSRVTGVQRKKAHLYAGLPILPREDFYIWAKGNADFWRLFKLWQKANYAQKLSPSINRIDPDDGYVLGNIEWLTHSLNSSLARHTTDAMFQRIYTNAAA